MPAAGDVPPAVVSLLARRLDRLGFGATLVDLAAGGWFEVRAPRRTAGRKVRRGREDRPCAWSPRRRRAGR